MELLVLNSHTFEPPKGTYEVPQFCPDGAEHKSTRLKSLILIQIEGNHYNVFC